MGDLNAETLSRLMDVLSSQAQSNTELAAEVRQQGERVERATTEITALAASVDRSTSAVNKLVHHHQQECERSERQAADRRTLRRKVASAAWEVAKSPIGFLLLAGAAWVAAAWMGISPTDVPVAP